MSQPKQPSLTPADLIALRDEWRRKSIYHLERSRCDTRLKTSEWLEYRDIARVYREVARDLDALITRVDGQPESDGRPTAASNEPITFKCKDVLVVGELKRAKRRALSIFDEWQRVTGCLDGSSYQWEVASLIEDAVEIGVQAAFGVHRPLESEQDGDAVDPVGEAPAAASDPAREGICDTCGGPCVYHGRRHPPDTELISNPGITVPVLCQCGHNRQSHTPMCQACTCEAWQP